MAQAKLSDIVQKGLRLCLSLDYDISKEWYQLSNEGRKQIIELATLVKYRYKAPNGRAIGFSFYIALQKEAKKGLR